MRRLRPPVAALAALTVVGVLAGPAQAALELPLRELEGARFPDRTLLLTLPEAMALDPGRVTVRENGEPVSELAVLPATAADAGEFAVVLVIDASNSMRGQAIAGAVEAARAFTAHRAENQAVAILAFNRRTQVLLPLTTSAEEIEAALTEPPPLARHTHIRDAVDEALTMLAAEGATVGSVVVLSDGADTGSAVSEAAVAERAETAGVRIFTVGLRSRTFEAGPLASLARRTGGEYAEATSAKALTGIFGAIGARLASEYLVQYRSAAEPDTRVHVAVRIEGIDGVGLSEYATPAAPADAGPPFRRPLVERFVLSAAGAVATTLAVALAVALGFLVLIRPRPRTLRRRLAEFVSIALSDRRKEEGGHSDLVLARADKSLAETRWWSRFREDLEVAEIRIPAMQLAVGTLVASLFAAWLVQAVLGSAVFTLFALGVPVLVRSLVNRRLEQQRTLFAEQLPDNLQVLASALRAGHSLSGSLAVLVEDCPEPSRREFRRVVADERLGAPLEESLAVVARRMASRDLEQVALVAALQRETGGNTAEVLDRVADTVRGRFELRRLVKSLTAQGRMSRWILSLLPVALLAFMTFINPAYVAPLYENPVGRVLLVVAGLMILTGSFVIKRIVTIKV